MLTKEKIARINELYKKAKQEGLTAVEQEEQKELRQEYIQSMRESFTGHLMQMKVVDPTGKDVTPNKLKEAQRKRRH